MSPVRQTKERNPRTLALAIGGVAIGIIAVLALFVLAVPKLTESGKIEVKLGDEKFDAGYAQNLMDSASQAPLLYSDPAGGQHDIYVAHTGDDPNASWTAYDARKPESARDCTLQWNADSHSFTDPCDHTTITADGAGLPHYPVTVENGKVIVDLNVSRRGTTTTTTSIRITGTIPR